MFYIYNWGKFEEGKLAQKDPFYRELQIKGISEHAQQFYNIVRKKTLACYQHTYLKTYVLLLRGVFETSRNTSLKHYKLDPARSYTAPRVA